MKFEVLGIDHIFISVSELPRSTAFYDQVLRLLGFRKGTDNVGGQPHVHYFNRGLQYTLRPAKPDSGAHDPLRPGLHHLCFQVPDMNAVDEVANELARLGVDVSAPRIYPEYGEDYYAIYFRDPDGIELEVVNRTGLRELIIDEWDKLTHFENPLSKSGLI